MNRKLKKILKFFELKGAGIFETTKSYVNWPLIILIIVAIVVIKIVIILLTLYFAKESGNCDSSKGCLLLSEVKNGRRPYKIENLNFSKASDSSEGYSFTTWLFVKSNNFGNNIQKFKSIMYRGEGKLASNFDDKQFSVSPGVWLYSNINKILIRWETQGRNQKKVEVVEEEVDISSENNQQSGLNKFSMNPDVNPPNKLCSAVKTPGKLLWNTDDTNQDNETCIDNIPLDRWFHLGIVLQKQSIDVYIDGNLYSTLALNSLPLGSNTAPVLLSSDSSPNYKGNNGFNGSITQLRYFNYPLTPYDILRIYSWGPHPFISESSDLGNRKKQKADREKEYREIKESGNRLGSDNY